eukprot:4972335-Amphidinium_carterae.1
MFVWATQHTDAVSETVIVHKFCATWCIVKCELSSPFGNPSFSIVADDRVSLRSDSWRAFTALAVNTGMWDVIQYHPSTWARALRTPALAIAPRAIESHKAIVRKRGGAHYEASGGSGSHCFTCVCDLILGWLSLKEKCYVGMTDTFFYSLGVLVAAGGTESGGVAQLTVCAQVGRAAEESR